KVAIPLPKGTGTLKVTTRDYFLPVSFSGRHLMLNIPFRSDPLGGTLEVLSFGPWPLQRHQ
ncbi:hypothetical protein IJT17_00510, partial [bacterium]|nr:hypothetical protein [bacterium]